VLREVIRQVGPYTLRPQRDRFGMLVRSIVSQQISVMAARSIRRRLEALVLPARPTAANLAALSPEQLRSAGLSPQKTGYLVDLCRHVLEARLDLRRIGRKPDEEVIADLVQVKGIGRWTAQMFLIFSLGRLDVLPHDDLGVRAAIRRLYGLAELPDRATSERIAGPWRPYASVGAWYCWRSIDLARSNGRPGAGYPV
jgi:DNA-3-methyladenine glycosylase II